MTSRNSFFSLLREDRKRRTWTIVVFSLLCFMMTVAFELSIESYQRIQYADYVTRTLQMNLEGLTESGMTTTYLYFCVIAAILFAFQGFGWLTKREQVDFYHSQPMKREKRFGIIYLNGFLLFEIPMILHMIAAGVLIGIRGCLNGVVLSNLAINTLTFTIAFLMLYSLAILGIMVTGNTILAFMMTVMMFAYPSAVRFLLNGYYSTYFDTFSDRYESPLQFFTYLSPAERLLQFYDHIRMGLLSDFVVNAGIVAVMAVVFAGTAFLLYKKRPSECAGSALAFPVAGDFIRILIVLPAAMGFGLMFASFSGVLSVVWLYFGTILGALLAHGFMEVVFRYDIRGALKKKMQLAATMVLALLFVSVFQFDLIGFDEYIPELEEIKYVSYYINVGEYMDYYHILNENGVPLSVDDTASVYDETMISREDYQLEISKTENAEPILQLVSKHLNDGNQISSQERYGNTKSMLICYELQNGKKVYRQYYVLQEVLKEHYASIYETAEGKEVVYPYLNLSGEEADSLSVYTPYMVGDSTNLNLSQQAIKEFVACYKEDMKNKEFDRLLQDHLLGCITLYYQGETTKNLIDLNVYVSDTDINMRKFFEARGVDLTLPNEDYVIDTMVVYNPLGEEETRNHTFWKGKSEVYLSEEQILALMPALVPEEYMYYSYQEDYQYYLNATVRNVKTGTMKHVSYYINGADVPDYLKVN